MAHEETWKHMLRWASGEKVQHGNSIKLRKFINNFSILDWHHLDKVKRVWVCVGERQLRSANFLLLLNYFYEIFYDHLEVVAEAKLGMMISCLLLYDAYSVQPFAIIHDAVNGTEESLFHF